MPLLFPKPLIIMFIFIHPPNFKLASFILFIPLAFSFTLFFHAHVYVFYNYPNPPFPTPTFCLLNIHLKLLQASCNAPFCLHLSPCLLPNLFMIFCSPPKVHTHVTKWWNHNPTWNFWWNLFPTFLVALIDQVATTIIHCCFLGSL